jgi:chromosome transmission fidelity protein 1
MVSDRLFPKLKSRDSFSSSFFFLLLIPVSFWICVQLVVLPYTSLLHKNTREGLGLELRGNVVIIDEAHNIFEAMNAMHSETLTLGQLERVRATLGLYLERYQNRLKAKNIRYLQQILLILRQFIRFLEEGKGSKVLRLNDFLFDTKVDNMNFFKIQKYFERSEIVKKVTPLPSFPLFNLHPKSLKQTHLWVEQVQGFAEKVEQEFIQTSSKSSSYVEKHRPLLGVFRQFLHLLTNADQDGRILVQYQGPENHKENLIQFILLNPEKYFFEVMKEAKALVLAGGTIKPVRHRCCCCGFLSHLHADQLVCVAVVWQLCVVLAHSRL